MVSWIFTYFIDIFKEQKSSFGFYWFPYFLYCFPVFSHWFMLWFLLFLSACFRYKLLFFSRLPRQKLKLLIFDLSCFLIYVFSARVFLWTLPLLHSTNCDKLYFHLFQNVLKFLLRYHLWLMGYSKVCCLDSKYLGIFQLPFC